MDNATISLALNAIIAVFMIIGFFWRFATKEDIKDLKGDINDLTDRLVSVETRLGKVETRLGKVETRLDNLEESVTVINRKADASLELHREVSVEVQVMQASILRLESYFETPKLKSS